MFMQLSPRGETLIKSFERLELVVYPDLRGIPTGGWGHTGWYEKPNGSSPGISLAIGMRLNVARAEAWIKDDVAEAVKAVNTQCAWVPLNQNQFDALVSFTFNAGVTAFAHSTLLSLIRQARFIESGQQFLKWDHVEGKECDGLKTRREAELQLFQAGVSL